MTPSLEMDQSDSPVSTLRTESGFSGTMVSEMSDITVPPRDLTVSPMVDEDKQRQLIMPDSKPMVPPGLRISKRVAKSSAAEPSPTTSDFNPEETMKIPYVQPEKFLLSGPSTSRQDDGKIAVTPEYAKGCDTLELAVDRDNLPEVYVPGIHGDNAIDPRTPTPAYAEIDPQKAGHSKRTPIPSRHGDGDDAPDADGSVMPLHLLTDKPDAVDCPFCAHRAKTMVKKKPSPKTVAFSVGLLMTTVVGACVPLIKGWYCHVEHYCCRCNAKVAERNYNESEFRPLRPRTELRVASKCATR